MCIVNITNNSGFTWLSFSCASKHLKDGKILHLHTVLKRHLLSPALWVRPLTLWRCNPWCTWQLPSSLLHFPHWKTHKKKLQVHLIACGTRAPSTSFLSHTSNVFIHSSAWSILVFITKTLKNFALIVCAPTVNFKWNFPAPVCSHARCILVDNQSNAYLMPPPALDWYLRISLLRNSSAWNITWTTTKKTLVQTFLFHFWYSACVTISPIFINTFVCLNTLQ